MFSFHYTANVWRLTSSGVQRDETDVRKFHHVVINKRWLSRPPLISMIQDQKPVGDVTSSREKRTVVPLPLRSDSPKGLCLLKCRWGGRFFSRGEISNVSHNRCQTLITYLLTIVSFYRCICDPLVLQESICENFVYHCHDNVCWFELAISSCKRSQWPTFFILYI